MKLRTWMFATVASMLLAFNGNSVDAATIFLQDFETDTSGWYDFGGTITQVASGGGTLGVSSAGGSAGHAEVALGTSAGNGAYTAFGGYSYTWPGNIRQSLDVYIDPNAGNIGDGWFLDNAVSDNLNDVNGVTGSSDWREAGGVGALKATDGNWWITADADGAAYQGPAAGGVGLQITQAGWYTIVSEWAANGDGLTVDRNTFIYDSGGTELYQNLNPAQVPLTGAFPIGGTRYGWLASTGQGGPLTLAIDNSRLDIGATVPEPSSFVLLSIGSLAFVGYGVSRKRRQSAA